MKVKNLGLTENQTIFAMKKIFIIGAQRSGTTFLNQALSLHPSIIGINDDSKEPKTFMGDEWPSSESLYESKHQLKMFKDADYCLEKSTSYYENWYAGKRIKDSIPDSKVIFIARNPYERMKSNYKFSKKNKIENLNLEDALIQTDREYNTSVNPYNYITRSLYSSHLIYWKDLFKDNLKIILFESLVDSNDEILENIFSWLDISFNDDLLKSISKIDFFNSTETINLNQDYGSLDNSLKYLFERERDEMEKLIGEPINCWNF